MESPTGLEPAERLTLAVIPSGHPPKSHPLDQSSHVLGATIEASGVDVESARSVLQSVPHYRSRNRFSGHMDNLHDAPPTCLKNLDAPPESPRRIAVPVSVRTKLP